MRSLSIALLTASSLVLLPASSGFTDEIVRHSGTIVEVVEKTQSIVLGEIGPWHGKTQVMPLRIAIASDTPIVAARRSDRAPSGFAGDFVEAPLAPWGLAPGDFVTVECRHEGGRLVARKVIVVDADSR
jgi:hypothetical protein